MSSRRRRDRLDQTMVPVSRFAFSAKAFAVSLSVLVCACDSGSMNESEVSKSSLPAEAAPEARSVIDLICKGSDGAAIRAGMFDGRFAVKPEGVAIPEGEVASRLSLHIGDNGLIQSATLASSADGSPLGEPSDLVIVKAAADSAVLMLQPAGFPWFIYIIDIQRKLLTTFIASGRGERRSSANAIVAFSRCV